MKIGIIGSGSAAAASIVAMFLYNKEHTVTCIHNPNIKIMSVGESLSPGLFYNLCQYENLNTLEYYDKLDLLIRSGARHSWEDGLGNNFDVNYYGFTRFGAHMNSEKFSKFIFSLVHQKEGPRFIEILDNVKHTCQNEKFAIVYGDNDTYTFDYLFDCRGFPTKEELSLGNYNFPDFETVNSVLLYQDKRPYNEHYTTVMFHRNGWMFGIPTTKRKAFGYMFNNDITSKEEALRQFIRLNPDVKECDVKNINWTSYSAKELIDGRIINMGNRLYFFEPIQGIPLHHYFLTCLFVMDMICGTNNFVPFPQLLDTSLSPSDRMNDYHTKIMKRYLEVVYSNYVGENNMTSDFWRITRDRCRKKLSNSPIFMDFCQKVADYRNGTSEYPELLPHPKEMIIQYMEGFKLNEREFLSGEYR